MKTIVIFREATGSCGRESHPPKTRFHAGCQSAATGLWLALALMASGLLVSSTATAEDASWQDPPKRKPRTVAQSYADDELPSRGVALSDDAPPATTPVPPGAVTSPSNQPTRRKTAELAAGAGAPAGGSPSASPNDEAQPTRGTHPASRRPVAVDEENAAGANEPFGNSAEDCDACDFGCGGPAMREFLCNRLFFRGEALLWWTRGGETPPLLTTSPASTAQAQAGVLGQPGTTILFGDQQLNVDLHAGGRMTFGFWLDGCEQSGLEFSYSILGQNTQTYANASSGNPILARPFFDVSSGSQNSQLIAYPNTFSGTFNATSTENFQGAEALWRRAIVRDCAGRIDLLAGYRFQSLTDGLIISDAATTLGTTATATDLFHTRNEFNGGELGFETQWHRNRWSFDALLKFGIGQTHTHVLINGWTNFNFANGTSSTNSGGLLALPSNMGTHDSQQFSTLPEVGFTLGYDLTPRLKATVGYTLLYWSDVARPGDQIDLNVDSRQFPPPQTGTFTKPEFVLHTSDFWAQGVNLGLDYRF